MKCHNARPNARHAKQHAFAPSHDPEESSLHVERSETNEKWPKTVGRYTAHFARKARKNATKKGECGHHRSDESSERDNETEIQVGAYGIGGPPVMTVNHLIEEDQPTADGSELVDDDFHDRAMLVEADLAPEVTLADEVNIQEEEKVILKKGQYKRCLFVAMVFYGLAIIFCITSFVLFFVNPQEVFWAVWSGLIEAAILHFVATFVILIPTLRCCRASIRLQEYAPDDKQLLRDAQIASTVSVLLSVAAMVILVAHPYIEWLGYTFMTWFFAGTVFASSRVYLLRRPTDTRQKTPPIVWVLFVLFFLGLTGITMWVWFSEWNLKVYPECKVPHPYWIGNGVCDGEPYRSEACGYDGGDCANVDYPDCIVEYHWLIGNGECNGRLYGTAECGFDGGDCLQPGERCRRNRDCASEVCNSVTKICDSVVVPDLYPDCIVEKPSWIGDGECDGGYYAIEACGFDGGDCLEVGKPCFEDEECASGLCNADTKICYLGVLENYPDCIVDFPRKIGDKNCDVKYFIEECGYDGGDCLP